MAHRTKLHGPVTQWNECVNGMDDSNVSMDWPVAARDFAQRAKEVVTHISFHPVLKSQVRTYVFEWDPQADLKIDTSHNIFH